MTVELLQTLSLIAFISAGVLFLVAIALFFLLDVPKLVGELSGRTAKKAIEAINQHNNESSGLSSSKLGKSSSTGGKLTDKITKSGILESRTTDLPKSGATEKFHTPSLNSSSNETTVLGAQSAETTVLYGAASSQQGETTVLNNASSSQQGETTVLNSASSNQQGETTVLNSASSYNMANSSSAQQNADFTSANINNLEFKLDVEMSFIGSSEIIE